MVLWVIPENGVLPKILIQCAFGSRTMNKNHNTETKQTRFTSTTVSPL